MVDAHDPNVGRSHDSNGWRSPSRLVLIAFLAIAGFFLVTEHRAHVLGVLPYLLLLACPLVHFFHGGHGGHSARRDGGNQHSGHSMSSHQEERR